MIGRAQTVEPDTLRLTVVADGLCAELSWQDADGEAVDYVVLRRYPDGTVFDTIGHTSLTAMRYCLPRQVCGDTVLFRVEAYVGDSLAGATLNTGESFDDLRPTSPCRINCVTVDSTSQRVLLSWHPSPDSDIMGYYICSGNPCLEYDTVWGRQDTTYLCLDHDVREEHLYRVLAFDSCYRASALTPYVGNLVLRGSSAPCSRTVELTWNDYQNLPGGVSHYRLVVAGYGGSDTLHDTILDLAHERRATLTFPDHVNSLSATVTAVGAAEGLRATSNRLLLRFDQIDSAHFLGIQTAYYDMTHGAIVVEIEADSSFEAETLTIYRAADSGAMEPIAQIGYPRSGHATYLDHDINLLTARHYSYSLGVMDRCNLREKRSRTLTTMLPSTATKGIVFPNVFTPLRRDNNRFCPSLRFVDHAYYHLVIYNRAGMKVFQSTTPGQCWDGTHNGHTLPQGVYTYRLRCRYVDGTLDSYHGTVMILR